MSAKNQKIMMKKIVFTDGEWDNFDPFPATFQSWTKANSFLFRLASSKNSDLGYLKVDFEVHFQDGKVYNGRIDIEKGQFPSLSKHIKEFTDYMIQNGDEEDKALFMTLIQNYEIHN